MLTASGMTVTKENDRTPRRLYAVCSLTYLGAMVASNHSLQHVSYPTQVVMCVFVCMRVGGMCVCVCVSGRVDGWVGVSAVHSVCQGLHKTVISSITVKINECWKTLST